MLKPSILFVTTRKTQLAEIVKTVVPIQTKYDCFFAENGEQAINLLATNKIDIVFSGLEIYLANGSNLIREIKNLFPESIRIAMVETFENQKIGEISQFIHQFIQYPFDIKLLENKIESTLKIKDLLGNQKIIQVINSLTTLPTLPEIYLKIEEEISKPDFSIQKISNLISKDPTLTAKILQIVNSAYFGLEREVTNINFAISYLGVNIIKSLVFYIQLFSTMRLSPERKKFLEKIWYHSLVVASTSYNLAKKYLPQKYQIESAYTAGVLHDIGKLVLLTIPTYPTNVEMIQEQKFLEEYEAEYEVFECNHAEIGGYLLGLWGFPHHIIEAVAFHHKPSSTFANEFSILTAVHLANCLFYMPKIDFQHLKSLGLEESLASIIDKYSVKFRLSFL